MMLNNLSVYSAIANAGGDWVVYPSNEKWPCNTMTA